MRWVLPAARACGGDVGVRFMGAEALPSHCATAIARSSPTAIPDATAARFSPNCAAGGCSTTAPVEMRTPFQRSALRDTMIEMATVAAES